MSVAFARTPRTRVMLPFNGQLDANGNGSVISQRFPLLALVNVALQVATGTAIWSVYVTPSNESGNLVGFVGAGIGGSVGGGPYPVAMGEYISVQITGGTPNAQVSGTIFGVQGIDIADLPVIPASSMLTGVAVSDAGLANATAAALSQLQHVTDLALTFSGMASFQFGAGQPVAYPPGTASWQVVIRGIAGTACKLVTTYYDNAGVVLYSTERHSTLILTGGQLVATGPAHGASIKFSISLGSGSGTPVASIYTAGVLLGDRFFDSGIYQGTGIAGPAGTVVGGRDGVLWEANNIIFSSGNTAITMPTYRGPIQITANTTNAPYQFNFIEYDYLHNLLNSSQQLYFQPSGGASTTIPVTIAFVAGMYYEIVFGNQTGANITASFSIRAIDDLQ